MNIWDQQEEAERLKARFENVNRAEFARDYHVPGGQAVVYQHITGRRPISREAALAYATGFGCNLEEISPRLAAQAIEGSFRTSSAADRVLPRGSAVIAVDDADENAQLAKVRRVRIRLSAGISGFVIDSVEDDASPIYFRRDWLAARGLKHESLIAIRVRGESMEPSLHDGDTVIINTADIEPKDGDVFAINYEGEDVVKRLVRDTGAWWLSSDNSDQRRFVRKECSGNGCLLIGKVIHKQSERI